jgi:hypothetical protein
MKRTFRTTNDDSLTKQRREAGATKPTAEKAASALHESLEPGLIDEGAEIDPVFVACRRTHLEISRCIGAGGVPKFRNTTPMLPSPRRTMFSKCANSIPVKIE